MKKFEWVDHPADEGFRAYGHNLKEAFENAALALTEIMTDTDKIEPKEKISISLETEDLEALLYEWIDFFIYLKDAENKVASKFEIEEISRVDGIYSLEAEAWGEKFDLEKHGHGTEVKAMTYHMMEIEQKPGEFSVQVVVDI